MLNISNYFLKIETGLLTWKDIENNDKLKNEIFKNFKCKIW
jgi:hypothetical protein